MVIQEGICPVCGKPTKLIKKVYIVNIVLMHVEIIF